MATINLSRRTAYPSVGAIAILVALGLGVVAGIGGVCTPDPADGSRALV
jgi:hypothetical protein